MSTPKFTIRAFAESDGRLAVELDWSPDGLVMLQPGDNVAITDGAYTVDIHLRYGSETGITPHLGKVMAWLSDHGVAATKADALELTRIWNGWDGPKPVQM